MGVTIGSSHLSSSSSSVGGDTTSLDSAFATLPLLVGSAIDTDVDIDIDSHIDEGRTKELLNISSVLTKEPETGILFQPVLESKHLFGVGVRKKYQVFNVYALGFYANPDDFHFDLDQDQDQGIRDNSTANVKEEKQAALLDPHKHRILRIVMNRQLTMDAVISALMDALEPRMNGKDLWALDEFSKLRNYGSLQPGEEIILTIQGENIECRCSNGGTSVVHSEVFTRAVCDIYFGDDPISPAAKASVMAGISSEL